MSLQTIISTALTFGTIWWIASSIKKNSSNIHLLENGDFQLKCHVIFAVLGYFFGALLLFFVGLGFYFGWEMGDDSSWVDYVFTVLMLGSFLYGFIYLTSYYYNHHVIYNAEIITVYNTWGKSKSIRWEDIKNAEINKNMQEIRLYTTQGDKLWMSCSLSGLDNFTNEFAQHHPYMVQKIVNRSFF